jgi:hypothetical protein
MWARPLFFRWINNILFFFNISHHFTIKVWRFITSKNANFLVTSTRYRAGTAVHYKTVNNRTVLLPKVKRYMTVLTRRNLEKKAHIFSKIVGARWSVPSWQDVQTADCRVGE